MASKAEYKVGDHVTHTLLHCKATIRYIGPLATTTTTPTSTAATSTTAAPAAGTVWYGLELEKSVGKYNGVHNGVQYFTCPDNHGIFVRSASIKPDTQSRITAPRTAATAATTVKKAADGGGAQPGTPKHPVVMKLTSTPKETKRTVATTATSKITAPRSTTIAVKPTVATSPRQTKPVHRKGSVPTLISTDKVVATKTTKSAKPAVPAFTESSSAKSVASAEPASTGGASTPSGQSAGIDSGTTASASPLTSSSYELISPVPTSPTTLAAPHTPNQSLHTPRADEVEPTSPPVTGQRQLSAQLLSPELVGKSNALKQAQLQLSTMKIQHSTLVISPVAQSDDLIELQKKYDQAVLEGNVLRQQVQSQLTEMRTLQGVEAEKTALQNQIESLTLDNELLTEQLDELKHTVEQHELTVQNQKLDIDVLNEQLQTAHDDLSTTLSTDQMSVLQTIEQNKQLVTALQQLKDITVNDKAKYTAELAELTTENRRLHTVEVQFNSMSTQLATIQQQNTDLQDRLDELSNSEQMIEYISHQNSMLNEQVSKHQADLANMQTLLDACNDVEDQHVEFEQLLQYELEDKDARINELMAVGRKQTDEIAELGRTISQFRSHVRQYETNTAVQLNFDELGTSANSKTTEHNKQLTAQVNRLELMLQQSNTAVAQLNRQAYTAQHAQQQYAYVLTYLPADFIETSVDRQKLNMFDLIDKLKYEYYVTSQSTTVPDALQHTFIQLAVTLMSTDMLFLLSQLEQHLYCQDETAFNLVAQQAASLQAVLKSAEHVSDMLSKKQYVNAADLFTECNDKLLTFVQQLTDLQVITPLIIAFEPVMSAVIKSNVTDDQIINAVQQIQCGNISLYTDVVYNNLQAQHVHSLQYRLTSADAETTVSSAVGALLSQLAATYKASNNNKQHVTLTTLYRSVPADAPWHTRARSVRNTLSNAVQLTEQLQSVEYTLTQTKQQLTAAQQQHNDLQVRHNVVNEKLKLLHSKQSVDYTVYGEVNTLKQQITDLLAKLTAMTNDSEHNVKENKALRKQLIKYKTQLTSEHALPPVPTMAAVNTAATSTTVTDAVEVEMMRQTIAALRHQLQALKAQQLVADVLSIPPLRVPRDPAVLHSNSAQNDRLVQIQDKLSQLNGVLRHVKTGGSVVLMDSTDSDVLEQRAGQQRYNAVKLLHQVGIVKQQLNVALKTM